MRLSSRGSRDLDGGVERISDPAVLTQLRAQARKVYLESLLLATALTAAALLLHGRG